MTVKFDRSLKLDLPKGQSAFLWGARKTGKSTFLKDHYPNAEYYDLLKSELFLELSRDPSVLRQEVLALSEEKLAEPIIVDEVQRVPELLDEIHWMIENTAAYFILCGSSARKLRREGANLLGGRAWRGHFYPLLYREIPNFDLLRALRQGLVPSHYLSEHANRALEAYVLDYLTQEIKAESLVRDLPSFARFLDVFAFSHGELVNYSHIARDCSVSSRIVQDYFQILCDTLLGYFILPYNKKIRRDIIVSTPKFYLFDVGVANYLAKRKVAALQGDVAGRAFEHFILMELQAYLGLNNKNIDLYYWRTKTGLEVDFILGKGRVAIEVKIATQVVPADIKGLIAFQQEHQPKIACVVCQVPQHRKLTISENQHVDVLPWQKFLDLLWQGKIIS